MSLFINRSQELNFLNERYSTNKPQFIVIWGRRRVGKTELIKKFIKDKKHIYHLVTKTRGDRQLEKFAKKISRSFDDFVPKVDDWEDLFEYFKSKIKDKRPILVLDEFPYLIESNREIPSLFQLFWDEYLKYTNVFLILCGSSIGMMEKNVLDQKSPLYGRRTGQIRLEQFNLKNTMKFFPKKDFKSQIEIYSTLDGVPLYLNEFSQSLDIFENIKNSILQKEEVLHEEVEFLLKEELRETSTYYTILEAIAFGYTKMSKIASKCNIEVYNLPKYLKVLENLNIIKKESPITVGKAKSKNTLYFIDDHYFRFFFRFVFPNLSDIEEGMQHEVIDSLIKPYFEDYVSFTFEKVSKQALWELARQKKLPFVPSKIGRWWHKDQEIDLVGLNKFRKEILFAECKWTNKKVGIKIVNQLIDKAKEVRWHNLDRVEYFILFSRSGFTKNCIDYCRNNNILFYDLDDLEKLF